MICLSSPHLFFKQLIVFVSLFINASKSVFNLVLASFRSVAMSWDSEFAIPKIWLEISSSKFATVRPGSVIYKNK